MVILSNDLNDMRRFYETFQILQAVPVESSETQIRQPLANKFVSSEIVQPPAAQSLVQQICQTVSD